MFGVFAFLFPKACGDKKPYTPNKERLYATADNIDAEAASYAESEALYDANAKDLAVVVTNHEARATHFDSINNAAEAAIERKIAARFTNDAKLYADHAKMYAKWADDARRRAQQLRANANAM